MKNRCFTGVLYKRFQQFLPGTTKLQKIVAHCEVPLLDLMPKVRGSETGKVFSNPAQDYFNRRFLRKKSTTRTVAFFSVTVCETSVFIIFIKFVNFA